MRTSTAPLPSAYTAKGNPISRDEADSSEDEGGGSDADSSPTDEVRQAFVPDIEFEGELGYSLLRAMRGRTTGRRLKRELFKQALVQIIVSVGMIIMTNQAANELIITRFFAKSTYCKSLISLWWLVCIIGFMLSFVTGFIAYGWPSLVTNRQLTSTILKIYMLIQFVNWIFTLATLVTSWRTFRENTRYDLTPTEKALLPYYITSILFLFPYMLCICGNFMNISYLNDELEFGGNILEPVRDAPEKVWDLSGMTLQQLFHALVAYPIAWGYQTLDLIMALYQLALRLKRRVQRYLDDRALKHQQELAREAAGRGGKNKKRKGLAARVLKTLTRWATMVLLFCMRRGKGGDEPTERRAADVETDPDPGQAGGTLLHNPAAPSQEDQERMEREREALEAERRYEREKEARVRREAEEIAKADRERRQREREAEEERQRQEALAAGSPILSVPEFKALWSTLGVAGQFQCKLSYHPELMPFTDHLRKQGFHIVFGSTPSPEDIEVGVCNIKAAPGEPRFMARFLSSQLAFSAVMKCESADAVPAQVKRFALAKILKIDTTKR